MTDTYSWLLQLGCIPVTLISFVQSAVSKEFTFSDLMLEGYYPGTFFNRSKYTFHCLMNSFSLSENIRDFCNVTVLHMTDITGQLIHPVYSCLFTPPEKMQYAKACFDTVVSSQQLSASTSSFNPTVVTAVTVGTLTGILFYMVKYCSSRIIPENDNLHLMELVDIIRHGNVEALSDYLRHHRDDLSEASLRYALNIAEQSNQAECYDSISLLLIEIQHDESAPRAPLPIDEADIEIETNERKLQNIGYDITKIPPSFIDPVDQIIMDNPVTLSTQQNVDQRTLQKLKKFGLFRCPITNLPLPSEQFDYPVNTGLKQIIDEYVTKKVNKSGL